MVINTERAGDRPSGARRASRRGLVTAPNGPRGPDTPLSTSYPPLRPATQHSMRHLFLRFAGTLCLVSSGAAAPQLEDLGGAQDHATAARFTSRDGAITLVFDETSGTVSRWTRQGGLSASSFALGAGAYIQGISADGSKVVGSVNHVPVVWDASFNPTYLDLSGTGFSQAQPASISGDGSTVVGALSNGSLASHSFRWRASTGVVDITPSFHSLAFATSTSFDGSVVVGTGRRPSGRATSFVWTESGGASEVIVPTQSETTLLYISDDGQVAAGYAATAPQFDLIRWTAATGPVVAGSLSGAGGYPFFASADCSTIIGQFDTSAFLWTEAGGLTAVPFTPTLRLTALSADGLTMFGSLAISVTPFNIPRAAHYWPIVNGAANLADRVEVPRAGAGQSVIYAVSEDGSIMSGEVERPDGTRRGVQWRRDGAIGATYCGPAAPNSASHLGARMSLSGSNLLALNALELQATDLPLQSFGFFIVSPRRALSAQPGGSQGILCLGGNIGRFVGPGQILSSGASGAFTLVIAPMSLPTPTGPVTPVYGAEWCFQAWFRDQNPASTSNFTDAAAIAFY